MPAFSLLLLALSCVGLLLSAGAHVSGLWGKSLADVAVVVLHVGAMICVAAGAWVVRPLTRGVARREFWKAAFQGCPSWMQRIPLAFFFYGIVVAIMVAGQLPRAPLSVPQSQMPPVVLCYFSAGWMVVYATAATLALSAMRARRRLPLRPEKNTASERAPGQLP